MNKKLALLLLSVLLTPFAFADSRLNCNIYPPNSQSRPICETLNNANDKAQYDFIQNFNRILQEKSASVYSDLKRIPRQSSPSFGPAAGPPQRFPQKPVPVPVPTTEPRNRIFY